MTDPGKPNRRELLESIAAAMAAASIGAGLAGEVACSREEKEEPLRPGQVALELSALKPGARVHVTVAGNPVEVMRVGDEVTARSLRCTHTGCTVAWREDLRQYVCPCHDGRYSEDGEVLAGPPPLPLRAVATTTRRGRVILGS